MAIDSNGKTYENRTLQFYGIAYGDSNVSLTATINGTTVFSGEVPTTITDTDFNAAWADLSNASVLFSITDSPLFPTTWSGDYPMSITVNGGQGVIFSQILCNYVLQMEEVGNVKTINSSISGNTLTIGTVVSGEVLPRMKLSGPGIIEKTFIQSGSGTTWTVGRSQVVESSNIDGILYNFITGDANTFVGCYTGIPINSENTPDVRSSVQIDGVDQVPLKPVSTSASTAWIVPSGSTISYNLNVSLGTSF
jgi:hypothetical protein